MSIARRRVVDDRQMEWKMVVMCVRIFYQVNIGTYDAVKVLFYAFEK